MSAPTPSSELVYRGRLDLPKRIHVGNAHAFSLHLKRVPSRQPSLQKKILIRKRKRKLTLRLDLPQTDVSHKLQLELRAPGSEVDKPIQTQPLCEKILFYDWICWFPHSGYFILALVPQVLRPRSPRAFEAIKWTVKVDQFLSFTKQELFVCSAFTGVVGVLALIIGMLVNVLHLFGR